MPIQVGDRLGNEWTVLRAVGAGGSATVFAVEGTGGRRAAAKVLHAHLAEQREWRARFVREANLLRSFTHRGLPEFFDFGEVDGAHFLIMDLLEGESLDARLAACDDRLSIAEVLRLADGALDVLAAAHGAGIVHRDLKPSNLFVVADGSVKVLDFGVARAEGLDPADHSTTTGMLGTPAYMSPEQARGRWDLVDSRSDLWAMGAVLFTLLTGEHVHPAATPNEQLGRAMACSARSIRSVVRDLPARLAAAIDKALAYDREDRWQTAEQFREALRCEMGAQHTELGALQCPTRRDPPREARPPASGAPSDRRAERALRIGRASVPAVFAMLGGVALFAALRPSGRDPLPAARSTLLATRKGDAVARAVPVSTSAPVDSHFERVSDDNDNAAAPPPAAPQTEGAPHRGRPPRARRTRAPELDAPAADPDELLDRRFPWVDRRARQSTSDPLDWRR